MTVQVSLEPEHIESLALALDALKAERNVCKRWGVESVRHALAVDDLEEILEQTRRDRRHTDTSSLVSLIGRSKPW